MQTIFFLNPELIVLKIIFVVGFIFVIKILVNHNFTFIIVNYHLLT